MQTPKMKVEIWSDIMCPFCYIGKRHYEKALGQFAGSSDITVEWHSFQLDPTIPKQTKQVSVYEYLAGRKGISVDQAVRMHDGVLKMAAAAGLTYNFDKAVVANSFDAHRVVQLAKTQGLGDEIEERFFKAYFTEGKDLADTDTLASLAAEIGMNESAVKELLKSDEMAYEVHQDVQEAQQIGVGGVPFFVFDRKYAISGAQPVDAFLQTLEQSHAEWRKANELKITND